MDPYVGSNARRIRHLDETAATTQEDAAGAARAPDPPEAFSRRVIIEGLRPRIDDGRFPIKRTVGESVEVTARIFADGHDAIAVVLRSRAVSGVGIRDSDFGQRQDVGGADPRVGPGTGASWRETPMTPAAAGTDEWAASFDVDTIGWHEYAIVAWIDRFASLRRDLDIKARAGQEVGVELLEGSTLVREAASRADQIGSGAGDAQWLLARADALGANAPLSGRIATALDDELSQMMRRYADRSEATWSPVSRAWVDRERARFGAWYEMFPRSTGADDRHSGTFRDACQRLDAIADLGFDVVYLPPIHPIGASFRKGRGNSLTAAPDDPGSPWAIGSAAGGHTAIDPALGTFEDFASFCRTAQRHGLEIALDIAWQCSPDHPWVREHPEWFRHRPDGTIKYAENPPKKYQDIYPLDFACDEWRSLWRALLDVLQFWIARGIRIFRVDNPHTKTFGFWEWAIAQVHAHCPDVIFLAEAFTRPAPMHYLAKAGFTQSYTYFTWRNTKQELTDYFTELTASNTPDYFRPNLFANTPDILHAYLQTGGRPAFQARLLLAATLGASYGIYSGFELCEARAVPGTEEYADSEKYQLRHWEWDQPGNINELVARVNGIRHQHRALQFDRTLRFHPTDNPEIIAYSKTAPDGSEVLLTVVNLDPHHMQHGHVEVLVPDAEFFAAHDLLDDTIYGWRSGWNYVRFDPDVRQGHIMTLEPIHTF
jgi:starch synthase (maltosyl-transferring)